jgi:hypothetical protein
VAGLAHAATVQSAQWLLLALRQGEDKDCLSVLEVLLACGPAEIPIQCISAGRVKSC